MRQKIVFSLMLMVGCVNSKLTKPVTDQTSAISLNRDDSTLYKVYKIDSVNSWYLIYAKKKDTLFKIVSKKEAISDCERILVNGEYKFSLNSIWSKETLIGNVNVAPGATPHVNCVSFDKWTVICLERDSINDLHAASNVKGLCFIR